jgi:hypothetical protein
MTREEKLREGVRILDPALRSAGFGFEPVYDGHYRCVRYVRRDYAPSARAITICCTSSVPSPIVRIFASR